MAFFRPTRPSVERALEQGQTPPTPQAIDDATKTVVLVYGPKGEALIERRPRPVGFRFGK